MLTWREAEATVGMQRACGRAGGDAAEGARRSGGSSRWGRGRSWLLCCSAWSRPRAQSTARGYRRESQAARLRLEVTPRATRGSAALPWRSVTTPALRCPAHASSTRLGV